MISIIICSVSAGRLARIRKNIEATIGGCEYEIIDIDNNEKHWSLTRVYNFGAERAKFPYLLFVHEDVIFHTSGWGPVIERKLSEPDCGVIGFAGSKVKLKSYSGWFQFNDFSCTFLYQKRSYGLVLESDNVPAERDFEEVAVLDGLAMFVRKDVWKEYRFDDVNLKGFHCYDIDFTLRIAAGKKYRNYVCCTPAVMVEHHSEGNMNPEWFRDTILMHRTAWAGLLPVVAGNIRLSDKEMKKREERNFNVFVRRMIKAGYQEKWPVIREFLFKPRMTSRHLGHCFSVLGKCLKP